MDGTAEREPGPGRLVPLARRDGLVVSEVEGDVLVYDLQRHRAHCLNATAALIWRQCDGRATIGELAALRRQESGQPVGEEAVWLALGQLRRARLLAEQPPAPAGGPRYSRQALLRKAGIGLAGGAVVLPMVTSVLAPKAYAIASCCNTRPCTSNADCATCSGCARCGMLGKCQP
jgi:hypothetical protein